MPLLKIDQIEKKLGHVNLTVGIAKGPLFLLLALVAASPVVLVVLLSEDGEIVARDDYLIHELAAAVVALLVITVLLFEWLYSLNRWLLGGALFVQTACLFGFVAILVGTGPDPVPLEPPEGITVERWQDFQKRASEQDAPYIEIGSAPEGPSLLDLNMGAVLKGAVEPHQIVVVVLFAGFVLFVTVGTYRTLILSDTERKIARILVSRTRRVARAVDYLGIPMTTGMSTGRKTLLVLCYSLHVLCFVAFWFAFTCIPFYFMGDQFNLELPYTTVLSESDDWRFKVLVSLGSFVWLILALVFLHLSKRLAITSLRDVQTHDTRAPILFLRAFADDQVQFSHKSVSPTAWLWDRTQPKSNLDEELFREGIAFGPVVAIGNPGDEVPPFGAARGYVGDDKWQDMVADLAANAAAIVLCVDDASQGGLWWEIEHLVKEGHLTKTLLLIHPKHAAPEQNGPLVDKLTQMLGIRPASDTKDGESVINLIGLHIDAEGRVQALCSSSFSRLAFLAAIRFFLRVALALTPSQISLERTTART